MSKQEHGQMTAERAIELLSSGVRMPRAQHSATELDEACRMACDALRLYSQSFQREYSLNAAIADHYQHIGVSMERLDVLAGADKDGRLVILPDRSHTNADGEEALRRAMWECNYKNNGVTRFTADAIAAKLSREAVKTRLSVKTPVGDIVAEASGSSEYPGIWISLHQPGEDYEPSLALVEFTSSEADVEGSALITRVWGDGQQEEYTDRVVHTGLEKGGAE